MKQNIGCVPFGGISNRLKCIISVIAEYENVSLNWDSHTWQANCEFNDLFKTVFPVTKANPVNIKSCLFIHPYMNTQDGQNKNLLPLDLKEKYLKVIKSIVPVDYITDTVNTEYAKLGNYTTVTVRTFKGISWYSHFKIKNVFKFLDKIEGKILLTCDDDEMVNIIKDKYDVYTTPKRTSFGDSHSIEGMQDILIDQYLGSKAKHIYGTQLSTFPEIMWWLGLCKAKYTDMVLHEKPGFNC